MSESKLSTPVIIIAVVILVGFVVLTIYLLSMASSSPELLWSRVIYVYGGTEAIAFAAAGYLFGREVHRQQAEKAEKRADEKTREAADATRKGERLGASVLATARVQSATLEPESAAQGGNRPIPRAGDLDSLARLASELYPELEAR